MSDESIHELHEHQDHPHGHPMTNSHILVQEFEYVEPGSLAEAISVLAEYGGRAQLLAGGTNLLVQMKMERLALDCVINVGHLPELSGITPVDGGLRLGVLTKIRALRNAPEVQADYAALAEACAAFGSAQIQMMGTLGGNLCNGSPASDSVPALMAFDAQLHLAGPAGERTLPVEEFLLGPGHEVSGGSAEAVDVERDLVAHDDAVVFPEFAVRFIIYDGVCVTGLGFGVGKAGFGLARLGFPHFGRLLFFRFAGVGRWLQ